MKIIVSNCIPQYDENYLTLPSLKRYGTFTATLAWTVQHRLSLREKRIENMQKVETGVNHVVDTCNETPSLFLVPESKGRFTH